MIASAIKKTNTKKISHEQWKKERDKAIGGSEAAAVMNLSPWKSPFAVWMEKTGQLRLNADNEYTEWGKRLEPVIAQKFMDKTGKKIHRVNFILQSAEYPWMIADIDRRVVGEKAIVEIKSTDKWNKDDWKDDKAPLYYIIQVSHYMAVIPEVERCYFAVLIGGNHYYQNYIERDDKLIQTIIDAEKIFWKDFVEPGIAPEFSGMKCDDEILKGNILWKI